MWLGHPHKRGWGVYFILILKCVFITSNKICEMKSSKVASTWPKQNEWMNETLCGQDMGEFWSQTYINMSVVPYFWPTAPLHIMVLLCPQVWGPCLRMAGHKFHLPIYPDYAIESMK